MEGFALSRASIARRADLERTQAGTGKPISYLVEYVLDGSTAGWGGEVLLLSGKRHQLAGGVLNNVSGDTVGQAVDLALDAEIDLLDIEELNKMYGI
ncbi:hypothetical protein QTI24_29295 [Variovorax sp. J22P240]|uniref:hypothetical protein n=1 Tax=Variovorax sp. J22P240 TaxID=3053514 RepID=UPI002576F9FC|nr:hypothetical protein [Variovorax sp. J22P240]MDM0002727.1 hypothetical protein [Variovorax sp. J22P240]